MGMFSSLFGSSGSDKADKLRQQAMDAFNAIQTPELKDLQVQLDKYVQSGRLTPEQAETELLSSNAFNDIVTDPSLAGAQKQALSQLQAVATQGGLTAVDKAQLNDIQNQTNQANRSQNEATMQQAQQRGMGGSDINTVNQLINEQGNADRASTAGLDVAAQAQARALQAMQAAGTTATNIRGQDTAEAQAKAQAQNAIDLFNKQTLNQTNLYNVDAANKAQAANLANAQTVANANTETSNTNKTYNAQQVQQQFQDAMNQAAGKAGILNGWANDATNQAKTEKGADMGLTSGLLQGGATALGAAFGGPAGAVAANSMTANGGTPNKNITEDQLPGGYAEGGRVEDHPDHPMHIAMGGHVHCYAYGGEAHHHPDCYMADGGEISEPPLNSDAEQSFMQGMTNRAKPSMPIEWDSNQNKWELRDKTGNHIGSFASYSDACDFADKVANKAASPKMAAGGPVEDFRAGGPVPGKPVVPHNSFKNDTVDAKLSPGEVVVPLDAQKNDDAFEKFMAQFKPSKKMPKIAPNAPLDKLALSNLHRRIGG